MSGYVYVEEFLSLKCAPDVLGVVGQMKSGVCKEITEAMGIMKALRPIVLREPGRYVLYDLCAGNGLVGVLAAHLLPLRYTVSVDKLERRRRWDKVQRFTYCISDIYTESSMARYHMMRNGGPFILAGCHPCKDLSVQILRLYGVLADAKHVVVMPCCKGGLPKDSPPVERMVQEKLSRYERWVVGLARMVGGDVYRDPKVQSLCNCIVTASKE